MNSHHNIFNIKGLSILAILLANFSLLSVGFSTWYSGIGVAQKVSGVNVAIGETTNGNSFFTFDGDATLFEYTETGLIQDEISDPSYNEAYISVPFQMDAGDKTISDCLNEGMSTSFTLRTALVDATRQHPVFDVAKVTEGRLLYKTEDSFTDDEFSGESVLVSTEQYVAEKTGGIDFTIANFPYIESSKVYFKVKLKLTFTYTTSFADDIYSKLDSGSFKFTFQAGVLF